MLCDCFNSERVGLLIICNVYFITTCYKEDILKYLIPVIRQLLHPNMAIYQQDNVPIDSTKSDKGGSNYFGPGSVQAPTY